MVETHGSEGLEDEIAQQSGPEQIEMNIIAEPSLLYENQLPNWEMNGHTKAQYRAYGPVVKIRTSKRTYVVPSRLEVLTREDTWQQHPVIMPHRPPVMTHSGEKGGTMIVFYANGTVKEIMNDSELLDQAMQQGLTAGSLINLKNIVDKYSWANEE